MSVELTKVGLSDLLQRLQPQMAMALPSHVTAAQIQRVVLTEVSKNPSILRCTQTSVLTSVMEACQLGLVPNSTQGLAYLVPYGTRCQLIPGYKGLIKLALQSGKVSKIWAKVVREKDYLEYEEGLIPKLVHRPYLEGDPGMFVGAYAVAKMVNDPDPQFEYMGKMSIDSIRKKSASGSKGPWADNYEEMAKKTVIRNLSKRLPLDSDRVNIAAEKVEGGMSGMQYDLEVNDFVYVDGDDDVQDTAAARLNKQLTEEKQPPKQPAARPKKKPPALIEVETKGGGESVSNKTGFDLVLAQLDARKDSSEDLREFYSRGGPEWTKTYSPDQLAEIDEAYQGILDEIELEKHATNSA